MIISLVSYKNSRNMDRKKCSSITPGSSKWITFSSGATSSLSSVLSPTLNIVKMRNYMTRKWKCLHKTLPIMKPAKISSEMQVLHLVFVKQA